MQFRCAKEKPSSAALKRNGVSVQDETVSAPIDVLSSRPPQGVLEHVSPLEQGRRLCIKGLKVNHEGCSSTEDTFLSCRVRGVP